MSWTPLELASGFGIALAVGMLIGIEREHDAREKDHAHFGGVRTFPIISLAGAVSCWLSAALGPGVFIALLAILGLMLGASAWWERKTQDEHAPGLTTEVAALVTFCIGAVPFAGVGGLMFEHRLLLTAALAGVVMTLLAVRKPLHSLADRIKSREMYATARFVIIAAVILPLLPNRTWDPWEAINPFWIGLFVVLICGISFAGYVAYRALGSRKGAMLTALLGGLASSTATTLSFSRRAREQDRVALFAVAVGLASLVTVPRVAIEAAVVNYAVVPAFAIPLGVTFAGVLAATGLLYWRAKNGDRSELEMKLSNPFRLTKALQFAGIFTGVRLLTAIAQSELGDAGLYASAALAGLAELNAITLSLADIAGGENVSHASAALALSIALGTSAASKTLIATLVGGRKLGLLVGLVLIPGAAAGVVAGYVATMV